MQSALVVLGIWAMLLIAAYMVSRMWEEVREIPWQIAVVLLLLGYLCFS